MDSELLINRLPERRFQKEKDPQSIAPFATISNLLFHFFLKNLIYQLLLKEILGSYGFRRSKEAGWVYLYSRGEPSLAQTDMRGKADTLIVPAPM